MVALPRTCTYCGAQMHHYGSCRCPEATIDWIKTDRAALNTRLERLEKMEAMERERLARKYPTANL